MITVDAICGDILDAKTDGRILMVYLPGIIPGGTLDRFRERDGIMVLRLGRFLRTMPPGTALTLICTPAHYVFVNDDGKRPLRDLVAAGLMAAELAGCKSVALCVQRSEQHRPTVESAAGFVREFIDGLERFTAARRNLGRDRHVSEIKLVADDADVVEALNRAL